jgi:hypothetical protein
MNRGQQGLRDLSIDGARKAENRTAELVRLSVIRTGLLVLVCAAGLSTAIANLIGQLADGTQIEGTTSICITN